MSRTCDVTSLRGSVRGAREAGDTGADSTRLSGSVPWQAADTGGVPMASHRRRELAAFLRSRRARLSPDQAGLPPGPRRRTPGLRREEVALLSGVAVTWYTWLEQGR